MITLSLVRAEWLKVRKAPLNRVLLGIFPLLILAIFGLQTLMALLDPAAYLEEARQQLPFPNNLALGVDLMANLGVLLAVTFAANIVGKEYGRDTWKVILPRYASRSAFVSTKWVVGLLAALLLFAAVVATAVVSGWLGALILGIATVQPPLSQTAMLVRWMGVIGLEFVLFGTMTLLVAVVTRSTIGAALVGILMHPIMAVLDQVLGLIMKGLPIIMPTAHLANLRARWVEPDAEAVAQMTTLFDRGVSAPASLLVALGYIVLMLGVSLYIFARRDMAGE